MYVGTLGKHKGVQTLITAFKHIPSPDIRLHIVGKGPDQEEFKQIASNDKRIIFHGFIENENVIKLIETANIMVVPSICYDNSPVVINESFITGTPVIGSKIGGIPENIHENVNGYLFEPENHDELKDHIIDLIKNTYVLKSLEKGAFNTVPDNSMDIMGEKLLKEYNKLINKIKPTI